MTMTGLFGTFPSNPRITEQMILKNACIPILLGCFALVSCSSDSDSDTNSPPPATTPAGADTPQAGTDGSQGAAPTTGGGAPLDASGQIEAQAVTTLLDELTLGYNAVQGVWTGFDPNDHPTIIVYRDRENTLQGVLAINHPTPAALGDATTLTGNGWPFTVSRISNPTNLEEFTSFPNFEFDKTVGGASSFLIRATYGDPGLDPSEKEFINFVLHEMFHRYQISAFTDTFDANSDQDLNTYPFDAINLERSILEERALAAAINAQSDTERDAAARRFVGVRLARRAAQPRTALDDSQEKFEGSARFLEHRFGKEDTSYSFTYNNFEADLTSEFSIIPEGSIKETFGFGRFYASGAAILEIARRSGVTDLEAQLESGTPPASVLARQLNVTEADTETLLAEARSNYDADQTLSAEAVEAAKIAESETPFGDEMGPQ